MLHQDRLRFRIRIAHHPESAHVVTGRVAVIGFPKVERHHEQLPTETLRLARAAQRGERMPRGAISMQRGAISMQ